jgi:hypothetical protein
MWQASYFADIAGGDTNLVLTPAQHRIAQAGDTDAIRRLFSSLDLRLFYVDDGNTTAAQATAPRISEVGADEDGGVVTFTATATGTDASGNDNVENVWVTYTFGTAGCSCWVSVDLTPVAGQTNTWTGSITLPTGLDVDDLRFIVQAANDAALVGIDDNGAAFHSLGGPLEAQDESSIEITSPAGGASGTFGGQQTVTATLTSGGDPLADRLVSLRLGTAIQTVVTDDDGEASATLPLQDFPGPTQVAAVFGGDPIAGIASSSDSQAFTIGKLGTQLSLSGPVGGVPGANSGLFATLKDANGNPLAFRSIIFVVTKAGNGFTRQVSTGLDGRASLGPIPVIPIGMYTVTAYFSGSVTLDPWAASPTTVDLTDPTYTSSVSASKAFNVHWPFTGFFAPVDNLPTVNVATAGNAIPIKFSLGGNRGLAIFQPGYPKAVSIACISTAPLDTIEELAAGSTSGLQYDSTFEQYVYTWKTAKNLKGKCYQFQLGLTDGSSRVANFKFK